MSNHSHISQGETEIFKRNVKLPIVTIGMVAGSITALIVLFTTLVPSKALVDDLAQQVQALKTETRIDHDTVTKLHSDVEYIRRWVEQQERKRQPL